MGDRGLRAIRFAVAAGLMLLALTSCFIPDQYEAEIRITKLGAYGITYNGVLVQASLFSEIARGNLKDEEIQSSIKGYEKQLRGDSSFKEVRSLGRGRFQVRYEREGNFRGAMQMVTFVSRQAAIFRVRTFEDGRISVAGSGAARQYATSLKEVGLTTRGLFRIVTDAEVLEHNATLVRPAPTPGYTMYDWRIRDLGEVPPRLIAKLAVDPKTGGPPRNIESDTSAQDDAELDAAIKRSLESKRKP